jgi:hypothetical protein
MSFETFDLIRTWEADGYRLELFDTYQTRHGKSILAYRFHDEGRLFFEGSDYGCSPMHSIDGDESVAGLLCFLSLRPGDTDDEWFEGYTPEQMGFAQSSRAEWLSILAHEMEEAAHEARR